MDEDQQQRIAAGYVDGTMRQLRHSRLIVTRLDGERGSVTLTWTNRADRMLRVQAKFAGDNSPHGMVKLAEILFRVFNSPR